jgi:hypothetical protein
MRYRYVAVMNAFGAASAVLLWLAVPVAGQAPATRSQAKASAPAKTARPWKAPRTVDGHPDLQGVWDFRTVTPLERPKELGGKQVLTDQEAEEFEVQAVDRANVDLRPPSDIVGSYNEFWFDRGKSVVGTKRTSLIVDPPDGRMPPLTPEAEKRRAAVTEARRGIGTHQPTPGGWVEDLGPDALQVRCILGFNSGPPITPGAYNQNVQLFQTSGHVVILNEMIHNARIVPLDGRPHLPSNVRQWVGDSRGHWEGETLVVETTNFLRQTAFARGQTTPNLRLVERFTRTDADTLMYEFTVNDPSTWTRPWTAQIPMVRNELPLYEYACHEGNYGLTNILAGARAQEKK